MIYAFQDYDNLYLVMDLLSGGDLRYHLCKYDVFTEEQSSNYNIFIFIFTHLEFFIACILLGLEYIHNHNIIHRDLKPENLVCDEKGYIRITDFGVAKHVRPNNGNETSGTPGYMAPEVLCAQSHAYPVDFYAIGIMGYEFMMSDRPYQGNSRKEIKQEVLQKEAKITIEQLPRGWSEESMDFFNQLMKRKQEKRLGYNAGVSELKMHHWFDGFDWEALENKTMISPFIPESSSNFDKAYCEGFDPVESETLARYQSYMQEDSYLSAFAGYTYIDEGEVKKYCSNTRSRNKASDPYSESNINNFMSTNDNSNNYFTNIAKKKNFNFSSLKLNNIESNLHEGLKFKLSHNKKSPLILNILTPTVNINGKRHTKPITRLKLHNKRNQNYSLLENIGPINNSSGNINKSQQMSFKNSLVDSQSMGILPINNNISITNKIENNYIYSNSPVISEKKINYNLDQIDEVCKNNDVNYIYSPKTIRKLDTSKIMNCKLPVLHSNGNNNHNKLHLPKNLKKKIVLPISINNSNFSNSIRGGKINMLIKSEGSTSNVLGKGGN